MFAFISARERRLRHNKYSYLTLRQPTQPFQSTPLKKTSKTPFPELRPMVITTVDGDEDRTGRREEGILRNLTGGSVDDFL